MSVETLRRPPPIDPRIRARRIDVARHAARRRLRRLIELALVVAVAVAFAVALRSPLLDVDEIRVAGADRTGADAVLAATGMAPGDQLMDLDLRQAGERIAALPWVAGVELHRRLDGTVAVQVTERVPAAIAVSGGARLVIDADGTAVALLEEVPDAAGLVAVQGIPDGLVPGDLLPDDALPAVALASRLGEAGVVEVTEVLAGAELVGRLAEGGEVRFGDLARLDAKVLALRTVLDRVDLACLATLDLRLPGNPVLTREDPCP